MTKKSIASNLSQAECTEYELSKFERETVVKLAEVLPVWYQKLGPGLDPLFSGLGLLLVAVNEAVGEKERSNATKLEVREAAVRALASKLAVPKLPGARSIQAARLRELGGRKKAKLQMLYEERTISLIVEDFPIWYDASGLSGFLGTLHELLKVFAEVFHGYLNDQTVERDKVPFLTAFEMRRRLNKVPDELLEALEHLGKQQAEMKVAA